VTPRFCKRVGPVIENRVGVFPAALACAGRQWRDRRAYDPEVFTVEGEISSEAMLSAEEIEPAAVVKSFMFWPASSGDQLA